MNVRCATIDDWPAIERVAKLSKYTREATGPHYLSQAALDKGWVGVIGEPVHGFVIVRHLVRKPYTSLYYVGVDPAHQGEGSGKALVQWALDTSPHGCVRLVCDKENHAALSWYYRHGFMRDGDGADKSGRHPFWRLVTWRE